MRLLGTEIIHFTISFLVGLYFWPSAGIIGMLAAITVGFLVDSDHLIDYLLYLKNWHKFSLKQFLTSEHFIKSGKLHIFFHGWEYAAIMLASGLFLNIPILLTMAISYSLHLTIDQSTNDVNWNTYFVTHRWRINWKNSCSNKK